MATVVKSLGEMGLWVMGKDREEVEKWTKALGGQVGHKMGVVYFVQGIQRR